ncbi:hypothetical protein [Paenibacillus durus]|uniref:ABC transmembrane type-1 domain-containing protein n=1 Tax=Paenibacillus durus TaxID=44251 RepID=A0A089HLP8_PAEDU|nr:hypothetical protein [Paenibacillus durus]AIQ12007.1 hypothetical protein PDUR_08720 [Paenibacillus durus]
MGCYGFRSSCAAYPLSRFQTKLNKGVYTLIIATLIVPPLTILAALPATLLYLFMQRWFISGLASGAVKG